MMTTLEAQPLYKKARDSMVARLISNEWKPGQMLPSEFAIAKELGVSQGTVRKALDEMTNKGLLVRKQGRGTFVADAEDKEILFRFYRLTSDENNAGDSEQNFPQSTYLSREKGGASSKEQEILDIPEQSQVWRFERIRNEAGQTVLWEKLILPCSVFPDISESTILPNNIYQYYSTQYGIIIARVTEELRAVEAPQNVATLLELPVGTPLLRISRKAITLDDRVVEWRVSLCRSDTMHYRNELV